MTTLPTTTAADSADAPTPARAPARTERTERPNTREQRQQGDAFDRLLCRKTEEQEDAPPEGADDVDVAAGPVPLTSWLPSPLLAAPNPMSTFLPARSATGSGAQAAAAAPAAFEAATTAQPPIAPEPAAGSDATAWQVTLNDPRGLAVELRVSRPAAGGAEAAPWGLTIGSGAKDAALLAQHASRLNERLRTRSVALSHLRIESDDEPAHSD